VHVCVLCCLSIFGEREREERETGYREKEIDRKEKRGREGERDTMKNCPPWK
jgi:hypothetical protein